MLLARDSSYNPWFVNGRQVEDIRLYDDSGVVMELDRGWLEAMSPASRGASYRAGTVIKSMDAVKDIASRRDARLTRCEHFRTTIDNRNVLFLYLPALGDYTPPTEAVAHEYATQFSMIYELSVHTSVNGQPAQWHDIRAARTHRNEDKGNAEVVRAVMELYNSTVPDHPKRHISESAAARLVEQLPELLKLSQQL